MAGGGKEEIAPFYTSANEESFSKSEAERVLSRGDGSKKAKEILGFSLGLVYLFKRA